MAVNIFLLSVLYAIAIYYTAEKIIEKLEEQIIDDALQEINKYVLAHSGDYLFASIWRPLGYMLSIAGFYLVEKFKAYAVEIIGKYVVAPVREKVVSPIGFQLNCLLCYKRNIKRFRTRMENLKETRDEVQRLVDAAERKDEVILQNIREWLTDVNKIIVESRNIFEDELQLNLKLYYQRSRYAKEKTADVDKLTQERKSFNRVSTYALAFESRKSIFEKIMEAVKDDGINMIGIYGMGGVGKTTLVKEVRERAHDDKLFYEIVMAVVSQSPDLKTIQGEIADMLGLKFDEETVSGRARRLFERLQKTKRILVILDDVWERVELEAIGIPFGEKHRGCKILLTSRSQKVCNDCNLIDSTTPKNFSIEVLSDEEGWKLFRKMAGDSVDSPVLHGLPSMVAKECAGLPLAIVTVARALQKQSVEVWEDALKKLRMSTPEEKVVSSLELSYNHLQSEEAKSFFLLCCLFPEDFHIPIESLMMYGKGCRLFKNVHTVDDARNRAHALADSLKSSCLLQEGGRKEYVKMHDVIRDVAISIASKNEQAFLVGAGAVWKEEFQEEDAFKRYAVISLLSDDIDELPVELECPKLQILLLRSTRSSLQFPDNLSWRMENLKVLNIFSIKFLSLPQSFENLKNLRTLCLNDCSLKDISIVGELKKLEIISFRDSDIKELPKEIGMLSQLKMLDLTGCRKLTVIPSDVIPSLSRLEGLYMDCGFDKWEIEREDKKKSNASLAELKHLSHLINLEIQIPCADRFPDDLFFKSLSRFKISVGTTFDSWTGRYCYDSWWARDSYSKTLKLELNVSTALKNGVKELLRKVENFHLLGEMKGLKSVVYDLDREGFRDLRYLIVEECSEVEHIFNASECSELQELRLHKLPRLMNIWKDPTRHVGFRNLTVVIVEACDGLKNLFSQSVAKQLSKVLVQLEVGKCKIMEEIVGKGKEAASVEVDDIVFLHLRSLRLRRLPKLRNFCSNVKGDLDTHTQEPLFDKKVAFPILETLQIKNIGNLIEIGLSQLPFKSFSQLKVLKVEGYHKVSKIVPFNLLKWLLSLEKLSIKNCDSVEEIIGVEGLVVEEGHVSKTLSQWKNLKLRGLPKLKHIIRWDMYPHGTLGFQNLSSIYIFECNSLASLFSPSMASNLVQLQVLGIDSCKMMESIIADERQGEDCIKIVEFPRLSILQLKNLPKLISFMQTFTSNFSIQQKLMISAEVSKVATQEGNPGDPIKPLFDQKVSFPQLEVLNVKGCHKVSKVVPFNLLRSLEELSVEECYSLEEVVEVEVEVEGLVVEERHVNKTLYRLRELKLWNLPKLKHIMRCDKYPHRILGFRNLSSINIFECHSLASLFSPSMASNLVQLQELEIDSCKMMESIIAEERQGEDCIKIVGFPQLSTLQLKNLPKLISFRQTFTSNFSVKTTQEGNLGDPIQPLFDKKVTLPTIEVLKIKGLDKLEDIWHPQFQAKSFCQLKVLEVGSCHRISNVIPSNLLKHLTKLEEVSVENCDSVEIIFEVEWLSVEDRRGTMTLSQLRKLSLSGLPKLFTSKHPILQKLQMDDEESKGKPDESNSCITIRPLFDEWVAFTNLVELQIVNIENLQEIFHTRIADESFSQLRILEVTKCHKLSRVAPSNLLPRLQNLEKLSVEGCNSMEKIFELEGEGRTPISLSQLEYMELCYLPSLLIFCSGKYDFELPSLEIFRFEECPKMQTFSNGLKSTPNLKRAYAVKEIEQCLYVIKDQVDGLHSRKQESSVEDEEKDKDDEVGEKSEEANVEEQERKENISAQAVHHEISEEAEQEGHRKGSMEAIREHLKVMTNLLDELGVGEEEDDEEEEGESEKAREANIEELQEIIEHLEMLVVYRGGLHGPERVVVMRKHLKRMMDLVDRFGLREQELSIEKLKRDISSGNEVLEEGEEGNASARQGIQHKISEIEVQAQL